jgi:hypothetical protein
MCASLSILINPSKLITFKMAKPSSHLSAKQSNKRLMPTRFPRMRPLYLSGSLHWGNILCYIEAKIMFKLHAIHQLPLQLLEYILSFDRPSQECVSNFRTRSLEGHCFWVFPLFHIKHIDEVSDKVQNQPQTPSWQSNDKSLVFDSKLVHIEHAIHSIVVKQSKFQKLA